MQGIATRSYPPIYNYQINVDQVKIIRGKLNEDIKYITVVTREEYDIQLQQEYILGVKFIEDQIVCTIIENYNEKLIEQLKQQLYGYTNEIISELKIDFDPKLLNTKADIKVEQILPEQIKQYQNPYGDGKFLFTFANNQKEAITIPATKQGIENTIVVQVDHNFYTFKPQSSIAQQDLLQLQPGEQIKFQLNTLKLPLNYPCGGNRIYFNFIFGDQSVSNFFYYYSSLHDKMRLEIQN